MQKIGSDLRAFPTLNQTSVEKMVDVQSSGRNVLARLYDGLFRHDEWNIGIIDEPISVFLKPGAKPKIRWLPPAGRGKYLADPFAIAKDERVYVLCEEFDYRIFKGRIVSRELTQAGGDSSPTVAIELPVHVAYPYLLEHEGEIYCIPETSAIREVAIYRAEKFPSKWKKAATLISDFAGVDSTVFQHDGHWWLMCTCREAHTSSRSLFIWHSLRLLGPWKTHAANPVKRDIGSSRPAGTPFMQDGHLFRPAQDCSRTNGGRIVLNRVLALTPTQFEEEQVAVIEPYLDGPYPNGVHTVSAVENLTVIDAKRFIFHRNAFKHALMNNVGKVITQFKRTHLQSELN